MASDAANNVTDANQRAWNAQRFNAWVSAFGSPEVEAARIIAEPERVLRRLSLYLGEFKGKRICNVQGSHGRITVALARQGADVTVVDFSEENRRFALDLAVAAGVAIDYALCDVMAAGDLIEARDFDVLVLELGILHYHQDIDGFFTVMHKLARDGGTLFLNEFHPVQRKLFWTEGPRDYFQPDLVEADVPNPDETGASLGRCLYRFWTKGEILTAVMKAGFAIVRLDEHRNPANSTIPSSFTLLAPA